MNTTIRNIDRYRALKDAVERQDYRTVRAIRAEGRAAASADEAPRLSPGQRLSVRRR